VSNSIGHKRARRLRIVAAAIVSIGLLVPLAAFGAVGNGQSPSAAQYKITICHHTHSKKHPMVTIRISNRAWKAHQRHGDTLGACPGHSKSNHGKHGKNGSHPSHPNHPSHPSTPSQGQNGSHPSHPTHPTHPSHPSTPSTPSQGQPGSGGNPGNPGKGHGK
jgi:hypothetical protein